MRKQKVDNEIKARAYSSRLMRKEKFGETITPEDIKGYAELTHYTEEEAKLVIDNYKFTKFPERRTYKGTKIENLKGELQEEYYRHEQVRKQKLREADARVESVVNPLEKKKNIIRRFFDWIWDVIKSILDNFDFMDF